MQRTGERRDDPISHPRPIVVMYEDKRTEPERVKVIVRRKMNVFGSTVKTNRTNGDIR